MHELPLVFFTVLGQTAVGMMLLAFLAALMGHITPEQRNKSNLVALLLLMIGMGIGGLHMGQPLRAPNMLFGLFRSPMSNEIVLSGLFFGFTFLTMALALPWLRLRLQKSFGLSVSDKLHQRINGLAVLFGLAFAWSITQVYQLETVPAWNSYYTSLHLWLTVLISGGMCALALGVRKFGSLSVIIGVALSLATRSGYMTFLHEQVPHLMDAQTTFWYGYLFAVTVALLAALWSMVRRQISTPIYVGAAGVVLVGELASRITFYNLWWFTM